MKELAKEYRKTIIIINKRVKELQRVKEFLVSRTKDPQSDPDVIELNERLKPLRNILNDLREVTKEIENYYNKGWWRSERYTLNQRKSRRFVYSRPTGFLVEYEPEAEETDETDVDSIDGYCTDRETETDSRDVLHR